MRAITDDEIVARVEQIKAHRALQGGAGHAPPPDALPLANAFPFSHRKSLWRLLPCPLLLLSPSIV